MKLSLLPFSTRVLSFALILIVNACQPCEITCEEWESLDESDCNCIVDVEKRCSNGIKDGEELFIDCGGDCAECQCEYQSCEDLTNSSQRTWVHSIVIEESDSIPVEEHSNPNYRNAKLFFKVDHTLTMSFYDEKSEYLWEYDDDDDPKILYTYHVSGDKDLLSSYQILKLNSDTLHLAGGWYNVISVSLN